MNPRRRFFKTVLGLATGATASPRLATAQPAAHPVVTPDISGLPFTMDNGVKVFQLTAEPVKQSVVPGRTLDLWGFNGSAPGPTRPRDWSKSVGVWPRSPLTRPRPRTNLPMSDRRTGRTFSRRK